MRRSSPSSPAAVLAERLCRPQRVGVFGHRGVGKTTLLTMLYRESVGGRLPGLRLAAADARTANHLSDKILQLESGQPLPATLAETDLRFNLHHGTGRLELLMKDYQGEHVEVGRVEPIGDFLRDCDAVWLCLDAATVSADADRLKRQQEVEHLVEQYLAVDPDRILVTPSVNGKGQAHDLGRHLGRPVAMLLTKADLLGAEPGDLNELTGTHFDMVRHALRTHCPQNALFAVSSLGAPLNNGHSPGLAPRNLADPLVWLANTLQAQDEARLNKLWELAPNDLALLTRCTACFAHRYPDAAATARFKARLRQRRRKLLQMRFAAALAGALALFAAVLIYDWRGAAVVRRFEAEHPDQPRAVLATWQRYQSWHPTRHLFDASGRQKEAQHLAELQQRAQQKDLESALAALRQEAANPLADPSELMRKFEAFHTAFPRAEIDADLEKIHKEVERRHQAQLEKQAQVAYEELKANHEARLPELRDPARRETALRELIAQAALGVRKYAGTPTGEKFLKELNGYLGSVDDSAIEEARRYSIDKPFNFQTRRDLYQMYLTTHPTGKHRAEAETAIARIDEEWDKYDFRQIRELYINAPGLAAELRRRCDLYLRVHDRGRYAGHVRELLRWIEMISQPRGYTVKVLNGSFDPKLAHFFSRGSDLAVEIEVNGIRYGPSPVVVNSSEPRWDYTFPRAVVWKLGDPVKIRVIDHDWKQRVVLEFSSGGDLLSIHMLTNENWQGRNMVRFDSDYVEPVLPDIE